MAEKKRTGKRQGACERSREAKEFSKAYLEAMLFTSLDDSDSGEPLEGDISDIAVVDRRKLERQASEFYCRHKDEIAAANVKRGSGEYTKVEQAGHDTLMTAQGHGVGFWDGDWEEPYGKHLTAAVKRELKKAEFQRLYRNPGEKKIRVEGDF